MSKSLDLVIDQRKRQRVRKGTIAQIFDEAIINMPKERSQYALALWMETTEKLVQAHI